MSIGSRYLVLIVIASMLGIVSRASAGPEVFQAPQRPGLPPFPFTYVVHEGRFVRSILTVPRNAPRVGPARMWPNGAQELFQYSLIGVPNATNPGGTVVEDSSGSLYSTTQAGGPWNVPFGNGTVFRLAKGQRGYSEGVIYSFGSSGTSDGSGPVAGPIIDKRGDLFGTTFSGGMGCGISGCGTVYELTATLTGYAESILYRFSGESDGSGPLAGLTADRRGNLFGTTFYNGGGVYELTPSKAGYVFRTIYSFGASGSSDGIAPQGSLLVDEVTGALYGTTSSGGTYGRGTAFRLTPSPAGYLENVLYSFAGPDGDSPLGRLSFDSTGALYGTTFAGGTYGLGTAFKLTPSATGYSESVMYSFAGNLDGQNPDSGLVFDGKGGLYGTTTAGGSPPGVGRNGALGNGTVFKLVAAAHGYREVVQHRFNAAGDGSFLEGDVLLESAGAAWATSLFGGTFGGSIGDGTIFALKQN
jgi:uncharacterized repeat protein (TIGR03803 family)